jgi:hypothetical protein
MNVDYLEGARIHDGHREKGAGEACDRYLVERLDTSMHNSNF